MVTVISTTPFYTRLALLSGSSLLSVDAPFYTHLPAKGSNPFALASPTYRYPFPVPGGVQATYLNKCVDGVSGDWVLWETSFQDKAGTQYPGSSFDSATYKVQSIVYQREQDG